MEVMRRDALMVSPAQIADLKLSEEKRDIGTTPEFHAVDAVDGWLY